MRQKNRPLAPLPLPPFLYFGDKKHLYLYIVDYAIKSFVNKFLNQFSDENGLKTFDILEDFDWIKGNYTKIIQENMCF